MIGNKTGKLGEDIAERFLRGKGYSIIMKNYWKPYGEIDIVCQKGDKLHFIEVKSVSRESNDKVSCLPASNCSTIRSGENIRPEDNVHSSKLKKLGRVIEVFLSQFKYKNMDWQFDVLIVYMDKVTKEASVRILENQILEGRK